MTTLLLIFLLLLVNYLVFLYKIREGIKIVENSQSSNPINDFVSIIVPFRNEEKNIRKSVESLSGQNYDCDKFEIIYVDDNSDDNSVSVLESTITAKNIKIIKSPISSEKNAHKKLALQSAINQAKGEIIVTTDADCFHGKDWLKTLISSFDNKVGFVSGPVEFVSDGSLFNEVQKIEFASLILVGAGLIGIKQPILCNAANLGFRRSIFNLVGGYSDNMNLSSGDDEFLMQKIAYNTDYEVKFCFNKRAICFTKPNKYINDFYQQRKRWASKSLYYIKKSTVLNLSLIFLFYLGLFVQFIFGFIFSPVYFLSLFLSLVLKVSFEYLIVIKDSEKLFSNLNSFYFFIAEIFHIPYILISSIAGVFGNYHWKGRKVKR